MSVGLIRDAVLRRRLPVTDEAGYQEAIASVLKDAGVDYQREFDLGPGYGRIDIFVPKQRLGIELKIKGSFSDVAGQLSRYAKCPLIEQLMLITGRVHLGGALPSTLSGKPLIVVATWRGCL